MRSVHLARLAKLLPLAGTVVVGGCFAAVERNLDILFSPSAVGNLSALPYSAVAGLLGAFVALVS